MDPVTIAELLERGKAAALANRRTEAQHLFFDVVERDPQNLEAWLWLGAIAEDPADSVAYLQRALEINPRSIRAQRGLAWAMERNSQYRQSAAPPPLSEPPATTLPGVDTSGLEPLVRPLSTYVERPTEPAMTSAEHQPVPDWESIVTRLQALEPTGPTSQADEALAASPMATRTTHDAISAAPARAAELIEQGKQQLTAGRTAEAIEIFRQAIAIDEENLDAYEQLGIATYQAGRLDDALAAFQAIVHRNPGHAEAFANIGFVASELGRSVEAIESLYRAVTLKADLVEAWLALAEILGSQGRSEEAIAAWERAVALRPDLIEARIGLAEAYAAAGRIQDAIAEMEHALTVQPLNARAHLRLGILLAAANERERAAAELRRALALDSSLDEARQQLALLGLG